MRVLVGVPEAEEHEARLDLLQVAQRDGGRVPIKDEVWPKFLRDNARRVLGLG